MSNINDIVQRSFNKLAYNNVDTITSTVNSTLSKITDTTKKYVNSTSLELIIIFFLIMYAGLAAHKLPESALLILNNNYVKFLYLVLWLIVVLKQNWTIAIIMIIIFLVTMKLLSIKKIDNKLNELVNYMLYKNYVDNNNKENMKNTNNMNNMDNMNNMNNMNNMDKMNNMNKNNESLSNNSMLYNNEMDDVYAKF